MSVSIRIYIRIKDIMTAVNDLSKESRLKLDTYTAALSRDNVPMDERSLKIKAYFIALLMSEHLVWCAFNDIPVLSHKMALSFNPITDKLEGWYLTYEFMTITDATRFDQHWA